MRALKLSRLERALIRKLYARRNTAATLMRMFQCCQTTVNRSVRNHMGDDIDDDDAIIRDADLPADVTAMLGLKDRDDDKALTTTSTNRWRPWAPTKVIPRRTPALRTVPKTVARRSPKVSVGHPHGFRAEPSVNLNRSKSQRATSSHKLSQLHSRTCVAPTTLLVYPDTT
ncbi:hypothetical protein EDB85DRAFT_245725 [Lactarius pseudohatsudake]|nr:hypothetical protein EDB85DRAFT_245725 [Lactarius pseudohatsudake]